MDVDDLIRTRFSDERLQIGASEDEVWASIQQRVATGRRRRRVAAAAAGALAVAAVAIAIVARDSDDPARLDTVGPSPTSSAVPTSDALKPDTWRRIADAPLSPRSYASAVWTGSEMLIVGGTNARPCPPGADCSALGGNGLLGDAAAYNPVADTWRSITDPVLPVGGGPAVWTGDLVLFLMGDPRESQALIAYNPRTDGWEARAPLPEWGYGFFSLIRAGDVVVVSATETAKGRRDWAYDPAADRWTKLPADPLGCSYERFAAWTGDELVVFGSPCTENPGNEPPLVRVAALDLATRKWRTLPEGHVGNGPWYYVDGKLVNPTPGFVDGGEVNPYDRPYALGGILDVATETWTDLPQPPRQLLGSSTPYSGVAGQWIVSAGQLFSPRQGRWHSIPPAPVRVAEGARAVWTGQEIIQWGGTSTAYDLHVDDGAAYTPPGP